MVFVLLLVCVTGVGAREVHYFGLNSVENMKANGEFVIRVKTVDGWIEAGRLPNNRFFREQRLDLGDVLDGTEAHAVEITQSGGGSAHIDAVFLDGTPPISVDGGNVDIAKIAFQDKDLADVTGRRIILDFPSAGRGGVLSLTGRIDAIEISKKPFLYPQKRIALTPNPRLPFYTFPAQVEDPLLIFKEWTRPGTGHPAGFTYAWGHIDGDELRFTLDFTPDNTYDGGADYAAVYIKTASGLKEHRIQGESSAWGSSSYTYTEMVGYQHMVYEFVIPTADLVAANGNDLEIAFAAYGTVAATSEQSPAIAFDPTSNTGVVVYEYTDGGIDIQIPRQLVNSDGTLNGSATVIDDDALGQDTYDPALAYDGVNHQYLAVWNDFPNEDIYGRIISADGTLPGSAITVFSDLSSFEQVEPRAAYDSANDKFLVVWEDDRNAGTQSHDIYGRFVNAVGVPDVAGEFNITPLVAYQGHPDVAYNSTDGNFLVVWQGTGLIYGQLVSGTGALVDSWFILSEMAGGDQTVPAVSYDGTNNQFLVVWRDERNGGSSSTDIFGQRIAPDGDDIGRNFQITGDATYSYSDPAATFDATKERFFVTFERSDGSDSDILGRLVGADGSLDVADTAISVSTGFDAWEQSATSIGTGSTYLYAIVTGDPADVGVGELVPNQPVMVSARVVPFDWVAVGATSEPNTVTITNESGSAFTVSSLTIGGTDASSFAVQNDGVTGTSIADAGSATFGIAFTPATAGKKTATVTVQSADIASGEYTISVEGLGFVPNNPPEKPVLKYPANGATGVRSDTNFIWEDVADADGDTVTYHLYVDTDQNFANTTPVEVSVKNPVMLMAGVGSIFGLVFVGLIGSKRRTGWLRFIAVLAIVVVLAVACGDLPGTENPQPIDGETEATVPGIQTGTTYYWKIVADDDNGGLTESDVWSFTTE
jgi:hypothetical protein